ncbi:MAG: hypothetical protein NTU62_14800 [Spirochaetes bacterium]|nr:hypothetical protein [Spirochaetota bacterium]
MRTTLNLDPEALSKIRLLSKQRGIPLGEIASQLILKAAGVGAGSETRNGVPLFPKRSGAAPDLDLVNRLRD